MSIDNEAYQSGEEEDQEIDEDSIYSQMYQAIADEINQESEETPNLDELSLSPENIIEIRKGGLETFKLIMQSRFKQPSETELDLEGISQVSPTNSQPNSHLHQVEQSLGHKQDLSQQISSQTRNISEPDDQIAFYPNTANDNSPSNNEPKYVDEQPVKQYDKFKNSDQYQQQSEIINAPFETNLSGSNDLSIIQQQQFKQIEQLNEDDSYQPTYEDNPTHDMVYGFDFPQTGTNRPEQLSNQIKITSTNTQKKKQPIVTDVFSLSGVKVSQYKAIPQFNNSGSTSSLEAGIIKQPPRSSVMSTMSFLESGLNNRTPKKQEEAINSIYRRHHEAQEKIQMKKLEKQKQEEDLQKSKKFMTKVSQNIMSNQTYMKPEERATHIQRETQEKRKNMLQQKKRQEIEEELMKCTFHPIIQSTNSDHAGSVQQRTFDEFLDKQKEWVKKKSDVIALSQAINAEKEMEGTTFKPLINKSNTVRSLKIEEKLIQDFEKVMDKRKRMAEDNIPLFKPVILPKSQELAKKRKDKIQSDINSLAHSTSSKYV